MIVILFKHPPNSVMTTSSISPLLGVIGVLSTQRTAGAKLEPSNSDVHYMVSEIPIQFMPYILSIRPSKAEKEKLWRCNSFIYNSICIPS